MLDNLAEVMLSKQTYNNYMKCSDLMAKKEFFKNWYSGKDTGSKKVDSAIRIFDSDKDIIFPEYLTKAVQFDS
jgi:hypothetical protein